LKVRIPLLTYPRFLTTQNKLVKEDLPSKQYFADSLQNFRNPTKKTAMRADVITTAVSEMILYSDSSEENPISGAKDTAEAETAA